jgi:hypothetical protein
MSAAPHEISPADRTVGQLVADTIRFYGSRFLPSVALGLVVAVFNQVAIGSSRDAQGTLLLLASPFFTLGYIGACVLVLGRRPTPRAFLIALVIGICAFLPVGILVWFFVLPALAWLAYAGLTVPAVLDDDLGPRDALNRAGRLSGVDYVHALGTLATLVVVYFLSRSALLFLLHGQADATLRTAAFLADLVLSPIIFLGSAQLYLDQKARLESGGPRRRRRDARLHHAVEPDRARRPDTQVEPGSPARGEP